MNDPLAILFLVLSIVGIIGIIWTFTTKELQDPEKKPE